MTTPTASHITDKIATPQGTLLPLEQKIKQNPKIGPKKVILIAGPTACGKSTLAVLLAKFLGGEVISVDSMQIYRGMDIGTAKITEEEKQGICHHLIDIRNVAESFNVVDFYYEAKQCCEAILARDKVPILCGGTGFYFRAFLYGPPAGPPSLPEIRGDLEKQISRKGLSHVFEELKVKDPTYAQTITPNDKHKIIRALEIIQLTGDKVSDLKWKGQPPLNDYAYHNWFIYRPRDILYKAIEVRCEKMLELGLIDEVKSLVNKGLKSNLSAAQAIGYRQCLAYLESKQTEQDYQTLIKDFKLASRHYAKRQFTWFRKEPSFKWINIDVHDLEIAADLIAQEFLSAI